MSDLIVLDYVFFFQAEDGIRGTSVTGVQTCALPISAVHRPRLQGIHPPVRHDPRAHFAVLSAIERENREVAPIVEGRVRSEERRVGKECRARWWTER